MPKRVSLRVLICGGMLVMVGTSARADDCLLAPNRTAPPGERWVYQTDRATNRRCFYLIEAGPLVTPAPQPHLAPTGQDALFKEFLHWQEQQKLRPQ